MKTLQWYDVVIVTLILLLTACGGASSTASRPMTNRIMDAQEAGAFIVTDLPDGGLAGVIPGNAKPFNANPYPIGIQCENQPFPPARLNSGSQHPGFDGTCSNILVWKIAGKQ